MNTKIILTLSLSLFTTLSYYALPTWGTILKRPDVQSAAGIVGGGFLYSQAQNNPLCMGALVVTTGVVTWVSIEKIKPGDDLKEEFERLSTTTFIEPDDQGRAMRAAQKKLEDTPKYKFWNPINNIFSGICGGIMIAGTTHRIYRWIRPITTAQPTTVISQ